MSLVVVASTALARDVPALAGRVNDEAGVLSPGERSSLEQLLAAHEQATGHQFAVLVIPSLDDDSLEDYTIRVVEDWKLGDEGKDDGVLMLVAIKERKIRIEVGYGLEGDLPDAVAGRVIRDVMRPRFRSGDVGGGITAGLVALMEASGWAPPEDLGVSSRHRGPLSGANEQRRAPIGVLIVIFVIAAAATMFMPILAFIFLFSSFGGLSSFFGGLVAIPMFLGMLLGGLGRAFTSRGASTGSAGVGPWFIGGFGGGYRGGRGGGGGFGGSGFGGFSGGGGGFGGGGASGGW